MMPTYCAAKYGKVNINIYYIFLNKFFNIYEDNSLFYKSNTSVDVLDLPFKKSVNACSRIKVRRQVKVLICMYVYVAVCVLEMTFYTYKV